MTFEKWIDELQSRFIFNIRNDKLLMKKLRQLWNKK
jgi:hypothetical protein